MKGNQARSGGETASRAGEGEMSGGGGAGEPGRKEEEKGEED